MEEPLLPARFLFRFAAPCLYRDPLWPKSGAELGEEFRLPAFESLEGRSGFAEVRAAWSDEGLAFWLRVQGKREGVNCNDDFIDRSDGLQLWIDTRDTHNIHRATRFCHRFAFLPSGGGRRRDEPIAEPLLIHRARENPRPGRVGLLQVRAAAKRDGYTLECLIPAESLTGFEPAEHPRLGFTFLVQDHELGRQTFSSGDPFAFEEDPSLWGTLELVK